jgi:hypothetical protein
MSHLQTLRCRFDRLCRVEHFLLYEGADALRWLHDGFAVRDGMIDSTGRHGASIPRAS